MTIVQNPRCTPWLKNSVNSEAPNTISGVVSGRISSMFSHIAAVDAVAGQGQRDQRAEDRGDDAGHERHPSDTTKASV